MTRPTRPPSTQSPVAILAEAMAKLSAGRMDLDPTTNPTLNYLRATAQSKFSLTSLDSMRASYPMKLMSPKSIAPVSSFPSSTTSSALSTPDGNMPMPLKRPMPPPARIVYMITYGGGLLADDHPELKIVLEKNAKLLILGQGNTKIFKSPNVLHPPASQLIHSTVGPGAVFLFLGPPIVPTEDSSVFLRHEIVLQARRPRTTDINTIRLTQEEQTIERQQHQQAEDGDDDDQLPNVVALDWVAGGRGDTERWMARRTDWRMIVRWSELDPELSPMALSSRPTSSTIPDLTPQHLPTTALTDTGISDSKLDEDSIDFVVGEDPRDIADRLAGGPVIFRDGYLIEHDAPLPRLPNLTANDAQKEQQSFQKSPQSEPTIKMTSYAPSLLPHTTIGSIFIFGPKTMRLQDSILRRFERITVYPGQKPEYRPDYPILWSATKILIARPSTPAQNKATCASAPFPTPSPNFLPKTQKMQAVVVKMAAQGVEQMQVFIKSLFEESEGQHQTESMEQEQVDDDNHAKATGEHKSERLAQKEVSKGNQHNVIDELFGGQAIWERAFR